MQKLTGWQIHQPQPVSQKIGLMTKNVHQLIKRLASYLIAYNWQVGYTISAVIKTVRSWKKVNNTTLRSNIGSNKHRKSCGSLNKKSTRYDWVEDFNWSLPFHTLAISPINSKYWDTLYMSWLCTDILVCHYLFAAIQPALQGQKCSNKKWKSQPNKQYLIVLDVS